MNAVPHPNNFHVVIPIVAGIGNALMAVPLARQLKTRAEAKRVTIIARIDAMGEPFRRVREVDDVIISKSAWRARSLSADVFIVPFPSNRWEYSMLALASGARRTLLHGYPIGYVRAMHFIGDRIPAERGLHDVTQNLRLLKWFGVEPDWSESPRFELRENDRDAARELLDDERDFIAVHAGSAKTILAESKRWPTEHYARLIESMLRDTNHRVIVIEGPDEAGVASEIVEKVDAPQRSRVRAIPLRGHLGVTAAVLERAAFYVGSDSGLAHLAAAVGTKPITIFGPADPDRVCPFGYRHLVVQPPNIGAPSFLYPWQATKPRLRDADAQAICDISVERVMEMVRRIASPAPLASQERTA